MKNLLELRKKMKDKKPVFLRQDAHMKKKLGNKWRSSKGIHAKMRKRIKGHRKNPSIGYSSPRAVRFLHPSGLKQILIKDIKQLQSLNPKKEAAIISKTGLRKKVVLLKKAKELGITILNVKNVDEFIKNIEEKFTKKKKEAKEKEEKKKKSKEESLKKFEEKQKEEKKETEEEKEKREKEEKRKLLEKGL